MRGNRVAVIELMIIGGQLPSIFKLNTAAIDIAHFYQLAIGGTEGRIAAIARQEQPVAGSHINLLAFMHRKGARLCWIHHALHAMLIPGDDAHFARPLDGERLMLFNPMRRAMEQQNLS